MPEWHGTFRVDVTCEKRLELIVSLAFLRYRPATRFRREK